MLSVLLCISFTSNIYLVYLYQGSRMAGADVLERLRQKEINPCRKIISLTLTLLLNTSVCLLFASIVNHRIFYTFYVSVFPLNGNCLASLVTSLSYSTSLSELFAYPVPTSPVHEPTPYKLDAAMRTVGHDPPNTLPQGIQSSRHINPSTLEECTRMSHRNRVFGENRQIQDATNAGAR